jgi:hypothetical protein
MSHRLRMAILPGFLVLATALLAGCPAAPSSQKLSFEYETHEWKENQPPLKLIKKDEGFCTISGIGGAFNGGGEAAVLYIGDDGYWYLRGQTGAGFLRITATCVKVKLQ